MSTVAITLDGDDITSMVVIESARFESSVNGVAGEAHFRVRDDSGTYSVNVGSPLVLTIDGMVVWRGFLTMWTRTYVFPALDLDEFGMARFFDATGSDINLLLVNRIVFNQSTPANVQAPLLAAHTADTTALTELFADWIDLTGDGIDTTSLVENVGDTTWTQEGRAWEGSDTWTQAVSSIARLPGAIWYIDPDKNFVYTDVDTPNAPFALSDQPNGTTSKSYSEMEILKDGTGLINDFFAWGAGYGSNVPVFKREEDATSQSIHGIWQGAQLYFGVYKQATLDRNAESVVYGSPENKRGSKDDKVSVQCTTFNPGLRVAEKVDFTSNVFGFNDVIPIRKMVIEFDGPVTPRYELTLSHDIDAPFSLIDNFMFKIPNIETKCYPPLVMGPNGYCILPGSGPGPEGCSAVVCSITDTFTRTETATWGTATCLLNWTSDSNTGGTIGVDGQAGTVHLTSSTSPRRLFLGTVGGPYQATLESLAFRAMRFQLPDVDETNILNAYSLEWSPTDHIGLSRGQTIYIGNIDSGISANSGLSFGVLSSTDPSDVLIPHAFWDPSSTYTVVQWWNGSITQFSISDGNDTYTASSGMTPTVAQCDLFFRIRGGSSDAITFRVLEIDIPEINRCTVTGTPTECYTGGPPPTAGPLTSSWVCEKFDVATTTLTLASSFLLTSPQVFINGLLQPQSAYTQDGVAGTITLDFTPEPADTARVCYWSLPS